MSNGIAYVLDERGVLEEHCNLEMVAVNGLNEMDERVLRKAHPAALPQNRQHPRPHDPRSSGRVPSVVPKGRTARGGGDRTGGPPTPPPPIDWESSMKLITTIVRPDRLPEVKAALFRAGITGSR